MVEISLRHCSKKQFLGLGSIKSSRLTGEKRNCNFRVKRCAQQSPKWRMELTRNDRQQGKPSTYSSRIRTDIPLYETPEASFDEYLEDKPRVFKAIFPDKRRGQRLSEEEWRIQMLPINFLFLTVWPVVDMRLTCKTKGEDYPPGVPRDISKVLELDLMRWELQGLDNVQMPRHFSLGVKGALYPDRRGPRSRLKGQLEMNISVILPPMLSLVPEDVVRNVSEAVRDCKNPSLKISILISKLTICMPSCLLCCFVLLLISFNIRSVPSGVDQAVSTGRRIYLSPIPFFAFPLGMQRLAGPID